MIDKIKAGVTVAAAFVLFAIYYFCGGRIEDFEQLEDDRSW